MTKRTTLQQRIKYCEERTARLKQQLNRFTRKRDTRRKVVAGACVLGHAAYNPVLRTMLVSILDEGLTRSDDRELFPDLLPAPQKDGDPAP